MQLALFAFLAAFLLISSIGILIFYRQTALRRLSQVVSRAADASLLRSIAPTRGAKIEKLVKPFEKVLPRSAQEVSSVQKRLIRAGYRDKACINIFYSSKVLVPGVLCLLATVTQVYTYSPLFVYAVAAGIGYLAPDFWLSNRVSARQSQLRLGLPEALDLIVICVEAGLSMDKATMRTCRGAADQSAGHRR
jgi:tight adherence protein C